MYQIHMPGTSFSKYVSCDWFYKDVANDRLNLGNCLKMFNLPPSNVTYTIALTNSIRKPG